MMTPLSPHIAHVWSMTLHLTDDDKIRRFAMLNDEEQLRAKRFKAAKHGEYFIAARSALRQLLGAYLGIPPNAIAFEYNEHKKPFLHSPSQPLFFNVSHCDDQAMIAITLDNQVGIDIEKVQEKNNVAIAEKYFSQSENDALLAMPAAERNRAFYRLWARKEAIVKAIGKGITFPLANFSVAANTTMAVIEVFSQTWHLNSLKTLSNHEAAIATQHRLDDITYYHFGTIFEPAKKILERYNIF